MDNSSLNTFLSQILSHTTLRAIRLNSLTSLNQLILMALSLLLFLKQQLPRRTLFLNGVTLTSEGMFHFLTSTEQLCACTCIRYWGTSDSTTRVSLLLHSGMI